MAYSRTPNRRSVLFVATGAVLLPSRLMAKTTIRVVDRRALAKALAVAIPGTVLSLAPGDYGNLVLRRQGGAPSAPLTLAAADPENPPHFEGMSLQETAHIILEGLKFDYTYASGNKTYSRPFNLTDSIDITVKNCVFDGDVATNVSQVDDGFGYAFGLSATEVRGLTIDSCRIYNFFRGLVVGHCDDVRVIGNNLYDLRSDGMNFAQVNRVTIEGNYIHDFRRSLDSDDHPDMIQFWTSGTSKPSSFVTIRGNVLSSGTGFETQSIFMRNELVDSGSAGHEMYYRDILIEENVISNAHLHGITVGETKGLKIQRNTIVRNKRSIRYNPSLAIWTPAILVSEDATNVTINGNIVSTIAGYSGQRSWDVSHNLFVQDRSRLEPGFYDTVFTGSPTNVGGFRYRKGGPADEIGVGASILRHH